MAEILAETLLQTKHKNLNKTEICNIIIAICIEHQTTKKKDSEIKENTNTHDTRSTRK